MKSKKVLLAISVAMASASFAQQGGAWSPDYGLPMPNYFSGTNCRAYGNLYIKQPPFGWPSPPQFLDAQLYINGTLVDSWASPLGDVPHQHVELSAMFDSSHFANQENVHIRVTGHDNVEINDGEFRFYDSDIDDPGNDAEARNKAILFEHPDPALSPDVVPIVHLELIGSNYTRTAVNGGQWTESQYFSEMNGANVVFYAGHGNPNLHSAGDDGAIFWGDYELERSAHIGSGIPPFNTGSPSVNFLYLLACNCGQTNNFVRACLPYYMLWGGVWMENQCWLGYNVYTILQQYLQHVELIWPVLRDGYTVLTAQNEFNEYLDDNPGIIECWDYSANPDLDKPRAMVPGDIRLYSSYGLDGDDGACRIKSVYTGDNSPPIGWFRAL